MAITRKFLNWSQPALPAAAAWLLDTWTMMGAADLSKVIVVVPGRRAGRRLLELLVETADERQVRLTPPTVETVGRLPERLYRPQRKFAGDLVNRFAWTAALRRVADEDIRKIIPDPPGDHDISRWLSFGELLWKQHRELAAEGLDFQDVIDRGAEVASFDEAERWQILSTVQRTCLDLLDELELWDLQSARLFAVRHGECQTDADIVLVGTADLNQSTQDMLAQVADKVTALIHAPPALAKRFDPFGSIDPEAWARVNVELRDDQIEVADGPADQAQAVVNTLRQYDGRYRIDEVTVGIADERLVPEIDRHLAEQNVAARWVVGQKLAESRPCRLLLAVAEYLDSDAFDAYAALLRHADLDQWILRQPMTVVEEATEEDSEDKTDHQADASDSREETDSTALHSTGRGSDDPAWLRQLDDYFNRHLPPTPGQWIQTEQRIDRLQHADRCVQELLKPLRPKTLGLSDWVDVLTSLLTTVYGEVDFEIDRPADAYTLAACQKIYETLLTHSEIPASLMPTVSAAQAIRLLLKELQQDAVPPLPNDQAIELLGWLELPLDDSPALVVTSFNDSYVPSALNSDAFLPNTLRRHLGLLDNRRRYARDAYALTVLTKCRRDLKLIVGRRDLRGDPMKPSRLLFAAEAEQIADRVLQCFREAEPPPAVAAQNFDVKAERSTGQSLQIPRPVALQRPPDHLSVTAFRTYLACPYRFYLRHILRLKDVDDSANELDALMFGELMHEVLNRFGEGPLKNSTDPKAIRTELRSLLDTCVKEVLGEERLAAVNVQVMQLRWRLDAFADWQARWASEGWRIIFSEVSFQDSGVELQLYDGRSLALSGRIDRIDQRGSEYVIFDYKSGESVKQPRAAHQKKDQWIDLQLPLYRHLADHLGLKGQVQLGYVVLPRDTKKVQHLLADWTEEELEAADQTAKEVAANVLDEKFWPPSPDVQEKHFPEFAAICQDGVFDREVPA